MNKFLSPLLLCLLVSCDRKKSTGAGAFVPPDPSAIIATSPTNKLVFSAEEAFDPGGRLAELEKRISALESANRVRDFMDVPRTVTLDSENKEFSPICTDLGQLLLKFQDATPYLDGFKIRIAIGNPYRLEINNYILRVDWGPVWKAGDFKDYSEWKAGQRTKSLEMVEALKSGYWNEVEFVVTPASAYSLKNLRVSIAPKTISLNARASP